jgi:hypothetical protein
VRGHRFADYAGQGAQLEQLGTLGRVHFTAAAPQAVAPQAVGAPNVLVPFQAASHEIIFDAFTSDSWTPGAAAVNLFNGSLGQVKPYGYLANLWLKLTTAGGTVGSGTLAADAPLNAIQVFRFVDPNGHAIIDCDGYGLFLLNKYGARYWLGDASGPYRIQATGNTTGAIHTVAPTAESVVTLAVGGEFLSLPDRVSRVNGNPQAIAPPGLDRGVAIVCEYTKQTFGIQAGGGVQTIRLTRVGNIIRQLFLVARTSAGVRTDWAASALAAGTLIQFAFDTVPIWQADPQHVLEQMARRRSGSITLDTGVLVVDFASPSELAIGTLGSDAGFDQFIQTAQSSALELTFNWAAGVGGGNLEVYTTDITMTRLDGQPYSFAYAGQLLAPAQPSLRS